MIKTTITTEDKYLGFIMSDRRSKTTTEIGKDYGISARKLNTILVSAGVQRRNQFGNWEVCTAHEQKGLTTISEFPFMHSNGRQDMATTMRWSQTGRLMIHGILAGEGIHPKKKVTA